jgi:hypothetical protein
MVHVQDDNDKAAHLLCTDGAISHLEKWGRAVSTVAAPDASAGFVVHV